MTYEARRQKYRTFIVNTREYGTVSDTFIDLDNALRVMNDGEEIDGYIASITEFYNEAIDSREFTVIIGVDA